MARLPLAVAERQEVGAQHRQKGVEDAVADVNADIATAVAPLDVECTVEFVAGGVLAIWMGERIKSGTADARR